MKPTSHECSIVKTVRMLRKDTSGSTRASTAMNATSYLLEHQTITHIAEKFSIDLEYFTSCIPSKLANDVYFADEGELSPRLVRQLENIGQKAGFDQRLSRAKERMSNSLSQRMRSIEKQINNT